VLKQIADAGETTGTPVTLCGELAGKPISAMALIGIGYRSISMSAAAIGPVKAMLTELPYHPLKTFLDDALGKPARGRDMRRDLHAFAEANGVPL
jgi:phosphotransferase system enzyme I (PtsP)